MARASKTVKENISVEEGRMITDEDEKNHANNEISIDKLWSEKEEKLDTIA